jgi:hypothetical protein
VQSLLLAVLSLSPIDQESRRSPFFPDLPEGAETWGAPDQFGAGLQRVYYRVNGGDIESIADFYDEKMLSHYGVSPEDASAEDCTRFPPVGNFVDHEPGDGTVPFYYTCMFDRGGLNLQQSTEVIIQPGVPNEDPFRDSTGAVVIIYDQRWQP